jgi:hypothetical protein
MTSVPQTSSPWTAETIAEPLRAAYESGDLTAIGALLSPDVAWGAPEQKNPTCKNRDQVLRWYGNGRASRAQGRVIEVTVAGQRLLVGLAITSGPDPADAMAPERWQVLTIGPEGVCDIRGYEDRTSAAEAAAVPV